MTIPIDTLSKHSGAHIEKGAGKPCSANYRQVSLLCLRNL